MSLRQNCLTLFTQIFSRFGARTLQRRMKFENTHFINQVWDNFVISSQASCFCAWQVASLIGHGTSPPSCCACRHHRHVQRPRRPCHHGWKKRTKNGTSGARTKILRPLFSIYNPPKAPWTHW